MRAPRDVSLLEEVIDAVTEINAETVAHIPAGTDVTFIEQVFHVHAERMCEVRPAGTVFVLKPEVHESVSRQGDVSAAVVGKDEAGSRIDDAAIHRVDPGFAEIGDAQVDVQSFQRARGKNIPANQRSTVFRRLGGMASDRIKVSAIFADSGIGKTVVGQ